MATGATTSPMLTLTSPIAKHSLQVQRYNYFFTSLAERGISTFAFDQRGWGQTGQKTNTQGVTDLKHQLEDLEFFLQQELRRNENQKLFLFGHSMVRSSILRACWSPQSVLTAVMYSRVEAS